MLRELLSVHPVGVLVLPGSRAGLLPTSPPRFSCRLYIWTASERSAQLSPRGCAERNRIPSTYGTHSSQFIPYILMLARNQAPASSTGTDTFTAIFSAASIEYHRVTGKDLNTHPFAVELDACHNPEAVSNLLRTQVQAFSRFHKGDEKLMLWLSPTVHILSTFSATLGEGIGLVSHFVSVMSLISDISLSAILACEDNLCRYWCSFHGESIPKFLCHAFVCSNIQHSGCQGCYGQSRHDHASLRANQPFSPTSERLSFSRDPTQ